MIKGAMPNCLGEDTITRNVIRRTDAQDRQTHKMDRHTHRGPTDFGMKLIYPIFLTKKRV